jgi:hypothetical protein
VPNGDEELEVEEQEFESSDEQDNIDVVEFRRKDEADAEAWFLILLELDFNGLSFCVNLCFASVMFYALLTVVGCSSWLL